MSGKIKCPRCRSGAVVTATSATHPEVKAPLCRSCGHIGEYEYSPRIEAMDQWSTPAREDCCECDINRNKGHDQCGFCGNKLQP